METGSKANIEAARALFHEQLRIFEHSTPIYNIACCEALLGNSDSALEFLNKAVSAGFNKVDHIENDADLKSIRHLEGYKALIAALKIAPKSESYSPLHPASPAWIPKFQTPPASGSVPASGAVPAAHVVVIEKKVETPKPVEEKVKVIPVVTKTEEKKTESEGVLESMGFPDKSRNADALSRANGDIPTAIQILLSEQLLY